MIDWKLGGRTGSIRKWARSEVRNHLRNNPVSQNEHYRFGRRILRTLLGGRTFSAFIGLYLMLDVAVGLSEIAAAKHRDFVSQPWLEVLQIQRAMEAIQNLSSNLITVQIGILSITSLALALVTLIAQRDNASADIRVYYHESLAFELVASGVALLVVICSQLFWPLQTVIHQFGVGLESPIFEAVLLGTHFLWLLINLLGTAHFVATTLNFTQRDQREKIRRRYTANVMQPRDLLRRLEDHLYGIEADNILSSDTSCDAFFGKVYGKSQHVEICRKVSDPIELYDVRIIWVRWVLFRWQKRCEKELTSSSESIKPTIWFPPTLGQKISNDIDWCQRTGGVPFKKFELFVLKRAFRFKRVRKHG